MKLTLRLGAAIGIAALGACTQTSDNNNTAATNGNPAAPAEETVLPPDESSGATDTLGNQLDQLNESDQGNSLENSNEANSL